MISLRGTINLLKKAHAGYKKHISPRAEILRKAKYFAQSGRRVLTAIKSPDQKPLIDKIAAEERTFIESQGIKLYPKGDMISQTLHFLEGLRSCNEPELKEAVEQTIKEVESLAEFTPYEIRQLYVTFSRYLDLSTLDISFLEIHKHAKFQIITMLEGLKTRGEDFATLGEKEKILQRIDSLIDKLGVANVYPYHGVINYFSDLESIRTTSALAHEIGHLIYIYKEIGWPTFTPLTFYSQSSNAEEDFCENFALYMSGYLVFRFLAKISREWREKYSIINKVAEPASFYPNLASLKFFVWHATVLAWKHPHLTILRPLLSFIAKIELIGFPQKEGKFFAELVQNDMDRKFEQNREKASKGLNMDYGRKIVASLIDQQFIGAEKPSKIQYKNKSLEKYGLCPLNIGLIELLGYLPETVKRCLDENEEDHIVIYFKEYFLKAYSPYSPMAIIPMAIIVTPFGIEEIQLSNKAPGLFKIVHHSDLSTAIPLSEREIRASLQAYKSNEIKRQQYYETFEEKFGIKLQDSEHRAFSREQVKVLSNIFEKIPPNLLKYFKKVTRVINNRYTGELDNFDICDSLAASIRFPRLFLFNFLSNKIFCDCLIADENENFFAFLRSGGWKKSDRFKDLPIPQEFTWKTNKDQTSFLPGGKRDIGSDFRSFLYFSIALPDILEKIASENPKIKYRLGLFQKIIRL